jgi:hypothetical protein
MRGSLLTGNLAMRMLRSEFVLGIALLACGLLARGQEAPPPPVYSAVAENQIFESTPKIIYFDIVNVGRKTITGYMAGLYCVASDGIEHYIGGGGQDIIDASDPFPGSIEAKKPADVFGWIEPQLRKRIGHNIFGCPEDPAIRARVVIEMVLFDDGSGEGDERWQRHMLETRKARSRELQRWIGRVSELRQTADLSTTARRLYQDLVAANHESEQDPDAAASNDSKTASLARRQVQSLTLELLEYAKTHKSLDDAPNLRWRVRDLEKRAEHAKRGAGTNE